MTFDEADDIIYKYDNWENTSCYCHLGNPPCSKCTDSPSEEDYKEALELIELGEQ